MSKLELPSGHVVAVDEADLETLRHFRWYRRRGKNTDYAVRRVDRNKWQFMHRFLTGWDLVDHVNHNGLDNRRQNLRPATNAQNLRNRPGMPGATSKYKGVSLRDGKWRAVIKTDRKMRELGLFVAEDDAAHAYDRAARDLFGEYAWLNFPDR